MTQALYCNERGLYPFQVDDVARGYLMPSGIVAWDTGCIAGDAEIIVNRGGNASRYPLSYLVHMLNGGLSGNGHRWDLSIATRTQHEAADGTMRLTTIVDAWESGRKQTYTVTTSTGRTVRATDEHPFLTERGWLRLDELRPGDEVHVVGSQRATTAPQPKAQYIQVSWVPAHPYATCRTVKKSPYRVPEHRMIAEARLNGLDYAVFLARVRSGDVEGLSFVDTKTHHVHHIDGDHRNNHPDNLEIVAVRDHHLIHAEEKTPQVLYKVITETVVSVEPHGIEMTYDIEVADEPHNFAANGFIVHNTGKSHWAMALACLLVEDNEIDLVLLVAEKNKIGADEWLGDWEKFTRLTAHRYHGTGRQKRLEKAGMPQVLITTYETAKADLVRSETPPGSRTKRLSPGPLAEAIGDRRVLVVYDEPTVKIANRTSDNYKQHYWFLNRYLRKIHPETRAWGLTATPLDSGWENVFNQARLIDPSTMPTVKVFEDTYITSRDPYGRPTYRKDRMPEFARSFQKMILRRRKTDPELIDQFPKMVEEAHHVQMGDVQRAFYEMVESIAYPERPDDAPHDQPDPEPEPGALMLMRQIAGHPSAILSSKGMLARILVEELGADYIRSIPSAKTDWLIEYLTPLVLGQGAKVVVFTFFGPSIIPLLAAELRRKKMTVFTHYGEQTTAEMERARTQFRAFDGPAVFLTSDAGARGINLPEATYLVEYESALSFANRTQRINRIHRIDSLAPSTHAMTAFLDDTCEESLGMSMAARNEQHDIAVGDDIHGGENFLSAAERKAALRIARDRHKTKRKAA